MRNHDWAMLKMLKEVNAKIEAEHGFSLLDKFLDEPEVPVVDVLRKLVNVSTNWRGEPVGMKLWEMGKLLQRQHNCIPYKAEYEFSAGLWQYVREHPELLDDSPPIGRSADK